jgi:IPT/TIG domain
VFSGIVARFQRVRLHKWWARMLVLVLVLLLVFLFTFLVQLWFATTALQSGTTGTVEFLGQHQPFTTDSAFVMIALSGGALGGTLHAISSLAKHIAHGDFDWRWTTWYLTNPLAGAALATIFLFVLQAGLIGTSSPATGTPATGTSSENLYGIAAIATLSGLFTRHALEKLKKIFDVAFDVSDAARPPAGTPWISEIDPTHMPVAATSGELTIKGSGFDEGSQVEVAGTLLAAKSRTNVAMVVELPATALANAGAVRIRIRSPNGVFSNDAQMEVS